MFYSYVRRNLNKCSHAHKQLICIKESLQFISATIEKNFWTWATVSSTYSTMSESRESQFCFDTLHASLVKSTFIQYCISTPCPEDYPNAFSCTCSCSLFRRIIARMYGRLWSAVSFSHEILTGCSKHYLPFLYLINVCSSISAINLKFLIVFCTPPTWHR